MRLSTLTSAGSGIPKGPDRDYPAQQQKVSGHLKVSTVKPVLRDHCHERPPVLTNHAFLAEGLTFQKQLNL